MTTRSHFTAIALAALTTAAVLAGIGHLAEPGAPVQWLVHAVQALGVSQA
jgi:hypothetical protein